jgi:hypothetical protein
MTEDSRSRVIGEFAEVQLGDVRLNRRAQRSAERLIDNPSASFPNAMANDAELEGVYRLSNNDVVDLQGLLAPHIAGTHELAVAAARAVLVAHDTTECHFSELVEGMGFIGTSPGFLLHTALCISSDERHAPLGVLGMMPIVRPKPQRVKTRKRSFKLAKESNRWAALVERVEREAAPGAKLIHVMDREADIYDLLAGMTNKGQRFVIRVNQDRRVITDEGEPLGTLWEQLSEFNEVAEREVFLSARDNSRNPRKERVNPSRDARTAVLSVRAGSLRIARPNGARGPKKAAASLQVSFVHVTEPYPPEGEAAVEWLLVTSEPVSTPDEARAVIDHYRGRWRIEEYFKALKTGCAYEKRQLESLEALLAVLGLLAPIAWQLLALRTAAHANPTAPATAVLRETQIAVLVKMRGMKPAATLGEALLVIAKLGGHLKRNGPPGWITLGRGFEKLATYEAGWIAARQEM